MIKKYEIEFIRITPFLRVNKKDAGSFTITFDSMDDFVKFYAERKYIRIKGSFSNYFTNTEYKIFKKKYFAYKKKMC